MVMLDVLSALADAAVAPDDHRARRLSDARASWGQLTGPQRDTLGPIGKRIASGALSPHFGIALQHINAGARENRPVLMPHDVQPFLAADELSLCEALIALLTPVQPPAASSGEDDVMSSLLDAYAGYTEEDLDADAAGAFDENIYAQEAAQVTKPTQPAEIHTDQTPEQLLARFGLSEYRAGQREAVVAALNAQDSLVVMPTGGGKSLCYQVPSSATDALTVVVSPLVALIADQHRRLLEAGVRSVMLAASSGEDHNRDALNKIIQGWAQVVLCAPERLATASFRRALAQRQIGLFVVDEAHCVSEWGHDFRPDYLRLRPIIDMLGRPPVMAATATATPKVAQEIVDRLALRDPVMIRRGFDRPNLSFDAIPFAGDGAVGRKRATLLNGLSDKANLPAVVYCGTRKDTDELCQLLKGQGLSAVAYHAGLGPETRETAQRRFMSGDADVVVATNAFGMGVDKADIRSVWHWALPTSVEAYYQEAGRAGRDGKPARAVLLAMRGDLGRLVQFIKNQQLTVDDVRGLLAKIQRGAQDGVARVDPRDQSDRDRVALAVAERSGAVSIAPAGRGMIAVRLDAPLDGVRANQVCREATNRRWEAYRALEAFASKNDTCRRRQLLDHFGDDEPTRPLGRCCDICDPLDWLEVASAPVRAAGARKGKTAPASSGAPVDEAQLAALKAWRAEQADGKPAYVVATNAVLEEILRQRPVSAQQLLAIKGIGQSFITKYSDSLLATLATI